MRGRRFAASGEHRRATAPPRFVDDGRPVDGLDILDFVDCVLGSGTNCHCGDFDGNHVVNMDDLPGFISALLP